MESSSSTSPSPPSAPAEQPPQEAAPPDERVHKTKVIQFLGRTTPIILQNNNGPCPLLAICNVLLLKNCLSLSPDVPEVSQEKLLSLVAERLIDSNSNTDNIDADYVENQAQNISSAIDLLPRLTTGIDVNIKYRRIDNFEFTQECAIFDLLDIPLYHGWIVDPQDHETANAIGSKSYNTLMGELVALEAQSMKSELPKNLEEDTVDFAAATTATLGVPSPCISLVESQLGRKGDIEEEAELQSALKLSETELVTPPVDDISMDKAHLPLISEVSISCEIPDLDSPAEPVKGNHASYIANDSTAVNYETGDDLRNPQSQSSSADTVIIAEKPDLFFQANLSSTLVEPKENSIATSESYSHFPKCDTVQSQSTNIREAGDLEMKADDMDLLGSCLTPTKDSETPSYQDNPLASAPDINSSEPIYEGEDCIVDSKTCLTPTTDSKVSGDLEKPQASASDTDTNEPIYEGEDCILDSKTESCQNQEPVYEGEVILTEQVDNVVSSSEAKPRSEMTLKEGEVVVNFLRSSASQLTVYGLFCLQEGIKERELCVFFRNNHFNTMFKFEGELYILVTDQGYINQPDLVWEKLNEVNGDTLYMTGNFKEFKVDDHSNSTWDEQNAMSSTADYLASINTSAQQQSNINLDLQFAIALQQQEFGQQPAHRNNDIQQQPVSGISRTITPQAPRNSVRQTSTSYNSKQEAKSSKEKCTVM